MGSVGVDLPAAAALHPVAANRRLLEKHKLGMSGTRAPSWIGKLERVTSASIVPPNSQLIPRRWWEVCVFCGGGLGALIVPRTTFQNGTCLIPCLQVECVNKHQGVTLSNTISGTGR